MITRVALLPRAQEALDAWSDSERARFWKIVSVSKNAPEDGAFVEALTSNQAIRQMTGANMHVQYYYNAKSVIFRIGMRRKQKLNQTADPSVMPFARAQLYDFAL